MSCKTHLKPHIKKCDIHLWMSHIGSKGFVVHLNLSEVYKNFSQLRKESKPYGELISYGWDKEIQDFLLDAPVYKIMLDEHSRELANSINELNGLINSLAAWAEIIKNMNVPEKLSVLTEFINHSSTIAINLPYVIRSRFIYSIAHLCHQANEFKVEDWEGEFSEDDKIYFKHADVQGGNWRKYNKIKTKLEKMSNTKYKIDTCNFRNKYNHRYSPRVELGLTNFVTRTKSNTGKVSYGIEGEKPLSLSFVVELLKHQHDLCLGAYSLYRQLVMEHCEAMNEDKAFKSNS